MLTVGIDGASCRAALAAAEDFPQVYAAIGRHPNAAKGFDDADLAELRALAEHERCVAIGETGLDFYREGAPRADQQRAFAAQIALARETRQAAGDPLARGRRRDARAAGRRSGRRERGDALLLDARAPAGVPAARLCDLVRGQRHVQERRGPRARRRSSVPEDRLLVETDAPYLTPQAVRKQRNQPAFVAHTLAFLAELRGVSAQELGATRGAQRGGRVRLVSARGVRRPRPAEPAADAAVRRAPEPRARAELPRRLEHPRRDRARGRAASARTWCWRSAAAWACSPSTWPSARRTCTWWRSTSACARRWRTRRRRTRT